MRTRVKAEAEERWSRANSVKLLIMGFELNVRSRSPCLYSSLAELHSVRLAIIQTLYNHRSSSIKIERNLSTEALLCDRRGQGPIANHFIHEFYSSRQSKLSNTKITAGFILAITARFILYRLTRILYFLMHNFIKQALGMLNRDDRLQ